MREYDRTYAEVNLEAIRHNIREVRKKIRPETKIMAVVKADAYGHGAVTVAKALESLVEAYGVAMIEEALELREAGLDKEILILGYTGREWFPEVIRHGISQTIYSYEMAEQLNEAARSMEKPVKVHIKLDTGMSRLGFAPVKENIVVVKRIAELSHIEIEGIFSHFARADETTIGPVRGPFRRYMEFVEELESEGLLIPVRHISNSAAIISFPEANLDMVRAGIITYGLYPSEEVPKEKISLMPAMQWKSRISQVRNIEAGTGVSYGGTFIAGHSMRIATVPVGYADGLKRDLSGRGRVLVRGKYAPILGRVCMDQFMIDITEIPEAVRGDAVTIFGTDGEAGISVEEIAELSHSFNYEFVCSVAGRVPRRYVGE
ncbi:MAG: alanine racemase [Lachnospiraceae bacterium]|nr:alanine racemase [Lachnospiraceae bacterium]